MLMLALLLVVPATVRAGARDHEGGFFLRMVLGGGIAGSSIDTDSTDVDFSDAGFIFDIAIGGMVSDNLALHGAIFGWSMSDPDAEVNGVDIGSAQGDLTLAAFGGGLTYYFMPINIYVSGMAGFGQLSGDDGITGESDFGLATNFMVGKEWWVSGRWGLGLAASFGYHSIPDELGDESWSGTNFAVLFSATLN